MKTKTLKIVVVAVALFFAGASVSMAGDRRGRHSGPSKHGYGHQQWKGHHNWKGPHSGWHKRNDKEYRHGYNPRRHYGYDPHYYKPNKRHYYGPRYYYKPYKRHYWGPRHYRYGYFNPYRAYSGYSFGLSVLDPPVAFSFGLSGH